jgi:hypothetical protein
MMGGIRRDLPPKATPVPKAKLTNGPRPLKRLRKKEQRIAAPNERAEAGSNKPG